MSSTAAATMNNKDAYQTWEELSTPEGSISCSDESVTFASSKSNQFQQSSYQSQDEIGPIKIGGSFNDEESMTVALEKAQIFVDSDGAAAINGDGRVKVYETKGSSSVAVKIGKQVIVDFAGCAIDKKWTKNQTMDLCAKQTVLYQRYYLGPLTAEKAKEKCRIRSEWFLFHLVGGEKSISDAAASLSETFQLPATLHLFIVYRRNDTGEHELYPIRCSKKSSGAACVFYVDYGDPNAPKFGSINGLIHFYDNFGYINNTSDKNKRQKSQYPFEVFPLWKRPARVPTISEYSAMSSECDWIPGDSIFDSSQASKSAATTVSSSSEFCSSSGSGSDNEGETNCDI